MPESLMIDTTRRIARKEHRCTRCAWKARTGRAGNELRIIAGQPYIESYALGEATNPARFHIACWSEENA